MVTSQNRDGNQSLLDVNGVADYLSTTVRHIRRLIAERRIPHHKVGGLVRFRPERIDEWLAEHERGGHQPPPPRSKPKSVRSSKRRRSAQTEPQQMPGQLSLDE